MELEMENRAYIEKQIERIGKEVAKMSHQKPWAESMTYLMQLPGFGVITAMTVLAAIGEIQRFETAQALGELFRTDPRTGAKRDEESRQGDHEGRTQGTALGNGGSGADGQ